MMQVISRMIPIFNVARRGGRREFMFSLHSKMGGSAAMWRMDALHRSSRSGWCLLWQLLYAAGGGGCGRGWHQCLRVRRIQALALVKRCGPQAASGLDG